MMTPRLYLIMRNDIPSMNPGKLAAQAAHCANQFVHDLAHLNESVVGINYLQTLKDLYRIWIQDRGFGTTITLGAPKDWFGGGAYDVPNSFYNEIWDPTYPCSVPKEVAEYLLRLPVGSFDPNIIGQFVITDSPEAFFLRPQQVGAYFFGDVFDPNVMNAVKELELYP